MEIPHDSRLIFEAFDRNGRVNRATLATLDMASLELDDGADGPNIGQYLADMVEFRPGWLKRVSPRHAEGVRDVTSSETSTWLGINSIEELQAAFNEGDAAVRQAVLDALQEGRSFDGAYPSHPAHFLQHTIVHDSHHRGQILAILRRAGRPAEVREQLEEESWAVWRE